VGLFDVTVAHDLEHLTEPVECGIDFRTLGRCRVTAADAESCRGASHGCKNHISPKSKICFANHVLRHVHRVANMRRRADRHLPPHSPDSTEVRGTSYIRRRRRSHKAETYYALDTNGLSACARRHHAGKF